VRRPTLYFVLAGLLGAAIAVIPAIASGDSPPSSASFTAVDFAWDVSGSNSNQTTIAQGGTVTFSYPSGSSTHNADFGNGSQPTSCNQTAGANSGSVPPLPHNVTGPGWSGTCTFNTPGTYTFHCDLHHSMTGTIDVQGPGGTTSTTTPPPTTTGTTPTTTGTTTLTTTTTTTPGTTSTQGTTPAPGGGSGNGGSPLAGTASTAIVIAPTQHGSVVHGAVNVSPAGAGGTLELDLFSTGTVHGKAHDASLVSAGRRVLKSLHAGRVRFSVPLNSAAAARLRQRKRLALTVKIILASPLGVRVGVVRKVLLRT
jgi:plastocyanin